ncbi:MAG: DUF2336 domain-containing protein [Alphaproteobacteria bacterium]
MMNVTGMDVKKLTTEPSGRVRSMIAAKIAADYRSGNFSRAESDIVADIFRILVKDVEKKVRRTLSEQLCMCPNVPHDIIMKLAQDETEVAVPVLENSIVLTEDDLMAIVRSTGEVIKLCAVARRDTVSEGLSGCLMETRNEKVLSTLFENKGANVSEKDMLSAWSQISSSKTLLETLVHRGGLPLTVAEKIYFVVGDDLKSKMARSYKIGLPIADKAANDAREWEMLGILPSEGAISPDNDEDVEDLIDQLYMGNRLTHSLLIRSLCVGALSIFEAGVARLAGVPRVNARILLMDSGILGFKAIYKVANMPEGFYEAIHVLLRISLEETEFGRTKHADFRKRIIDRIYMEGYHRSVDNMEYLLSIIGGKIGSGGRINETAAVH